MTPNDRTNQLTVRTSPRSGRSESAGRRRAPRSAFVLGAHEYGDHTVIRALRPHAVEVVALIGGDDIRSSTSSRACLRSACRSPTSSTTA